MAEWIEQVTAQLGYFGIALAETVFPPIPSEVIMPLDGRGAGRRVIALQGSIVAGTAGAMAGDIFWHVIARSIGADRHRAFVERHGCSSRDHPNG